MRQPGTQRISAISTAMNSGDPVIRLRWKHIREDGKPIHIRLVAPQPPRHSLFVAAATISRLPHKLVTQLSLEISELGVVFQGMARSEYLSISAGTDQELEDIVSILGNLVTVSIEKPPRKTATVPFKLLRFDYAVRSEIIEKIEAIKPEYPGLRWSDYKPPPKLGTRVNG